MDRLKSIVFCLCALQIVATPIEYDTTESITSNSTDIETTTELFENKTDEITTTEADISANLVKTDLESRFKKDDDNLEIVTQYPRSSVLRDYDDEICDDLVQTEDNSPARFSPSDKPTLLNKPTTYHPKFGAPQLSSKTAEATTEPSEATTQEISTEQEIFTPSPTDQVIGSDIVSSTTIKYEDTPTTSSVATSTNPPHFGLVTSTTSAPAGVWRYEHFSIPNPNENDKRVFSKFGFGTKFNGFSSSFSQPKFTPPFGHRFSLPEIRTSTILPNTNQPPQSVLRDNNPDFTDFNIRPTSAYPENLVSNFPKLSTAPIIDFSTTTISNDIGTSTSPPPKSVFLDNNPDFTDFNIKPTSSGPENLVSNFAKLSPTSSIDFSTTTISNDIGTSTHPPPKSVLLDNNPDFTDFNIRPTSAYPENLVSNFPKLSTAPIIDFSTTTISNDIGTSTSPPPNSILLNNNPGFTDFNIRPTSSDPENLVSNFPKLSTAPIIDFSTTTISNDIGTSTSPPPNSILLNNNQGFTDFNIRPTTSSPENLVGNFAKLSPTTSIVPIIDVSTTTIRNDITSSTSPPPKSVFLNDNPNLNSFIITPPPSYPKNLVPSDAPTVPTDFTSTTISDLNRFNFAPSSTYPDNLISTSTQPTTISTPKTNVFILNNRSLPQFTTKRPPTLNTNVNTQYDLFNGIRTVPPPRTTTTTPPPFAKKIAVTPSVTIPHPSIELFSKFGDQEARLPPMNRGKINLPSEILPPKFDGRSDTTTEGLVPAIYSGKISFGNGTNPESKSGAFFDLQSIQAYNLAFVNSAPTNRFQPIKPRPRTQPVRTTPRKPTVVKPPSGSPRFSLDLIDKYTSTNLKIDTVNLGKTGSISRVGDSRKATFFNGLNIYNPSIATFLR